MGCMNTKTAAKAEAQAEQPSPTLLTETDPSKQQPAAAAEQGAEAAPAAEAATDTGAAASSSEPAPASATAELHVLQVPTAEDGYKVKVVVVSARGLKKTDLLSEADAYCTCEVSGRTEPVFTTAKVSNSANPEWNHEAEVAGIKAGDILTFTIKDKDWAFDDHLGKVTLKAEQFLENNFDDEVKLTGPGAAEEAYVKLRVHKVTMIENFASEEKEVAAAAIDEVAEAAQEVKEAVEAAVEAVEVPKSSNGWCC